VNDRPLRLNVMIVLDPFQDTFLVTL
jgi:hypothetical protein